MNHLLKITLRRTRGEKMFAFVNVFGLALGMASAILIFLFLHHETTYDTWHPNHTSIYRVGTELSIKGQKEKYAVSAAPLAPALHRQYPEITASLRIFHIQYFLRDLSYAFRESRVYEKEVFAVDDTFFNFFDHTVLEGDPSVALREPFSLVLTRQMKEELIGPEPALGQKIFVRDAGYFTVTAVIEDLPPNTHLHFKGLMSMSTLDHMPELFEQAFGKGISWDTFEGTFGSTVLWSFIQTQPGFCPNEFLLSQWPAFQKKYLEQLSKSHQIKMQPIFQPLADIHIDKDLLYESTSERIRLQVMNKRMVKVFMAIALFLLVTSIINYTNITISHFNKRRKEMAMIKVLGSGSYKLFTMFFIETFVVALLALVLSLMLTELIIPYINNLLDISINLFYITNSLLIIIILLIPLFTSILAGIFPTLFFAMATAADLLLKRQRDGRKSVWVRKTLILIQFTIASFLIAVSFLAYAQIRYIENIHPGFNANNVAVFELPDREHKTNFLTLDSILNTHQLVKKTAASSYVFTTFPIKHTALFQTTGGSTVKSFNTIQLSKEYLQIMEVNISDKDNSIEKFSTGEGIIVNRSLVDSLGFENPFEQTVTTHFQFLDGRFRSDRRIVGVIEDVQYSNLHQKIEPLIILPQTSLPGYLTVRFKESDRQKQERALQDAWSSFDPQIHPVYFFPADVVEGFYTEQRNVSNLVSYFAYLCVFIAFLGVYGITAYNIQQRIPEIAIRMALGARSSDIFLTFFKDYFYLLLASCILGFTLSYYAIKPWLQSFAYTAELNPIPFVSAGFLIFSSIFIAIGIHSKRTRSINISREINASQ